MFTLALCAAARGVGAPVCASAGRRECVHLCNSGCVNVSVTPALSLRTTGGHDMTALERKKGKDL